MSRLCFLSCSVSSGAKSTAWLHLRNEPGPVFCRSWINAASKGRQDAKKSGLSSVDILQPFTH